MTIRSVPVLTALALAFLGVSSGVAQPRVVATIPPIHSLASLVMEGVATPKVLLTGSESPHRYTEAVAITRFVRGRGRISCR